MKPVSSQCPSSQPNRGLPAQVHPTLSSPDFSVRRGECGPPSRETKSFHAFWRRLVIVACLLPWAVHGQIVTNWIAFNDHAPGPLTAPFVSPYNLRGVGLAGTPTSLLPAKGRLTNFVAGAYPSGQPLAAQLAVTASNTPTLFPNAALSTPFPDTPAYALFNGVVDFANADSGIGLSAGELDTIVFTFTNLNPAMRYAFRGTAVRNGTAANIHPGRWTICSLVGADSFANAHTPGVMTSATAGVPGLNLTNGQAVFQSGINTNGDMVGWDEIRPAPNGTFSILARGYSGPVTGGSFGSLVTNAFDNLGYGLCAIMLAEYGPLTGVAIGTPLPASITLTQAQSLSLSVAASGSAPQYQWYKEGLGPIAGANDVTYAVAAAAVADTGSYYVVVSNAVNTVTSSLAAITVVQDTFPPVVTGVFAGASPDQITIEFNETLAPEAAESFNYSIEGPNSPVVAGATLSPELSAVTVTLLPAAPLADDTLYTLVVSFVPDALGNTVPEGTRIQFRSRTSLGFNGLLFEAFRSISGNSVSNLTSSPLFSNSPQERLRMTRFDTREVYPDDSHENYGGRIRGLFIPPVSGTYKFYLRSDDASELWLNPAGPSASGKTQIAREVGCCNPFLEDSPGSLTSAPFPLKGGQGYYIEALYKEGVGGDYCQVAAKLETDSTAPGSLQPITSAYLGSPGAPAGIGGVVTITQQPTNISVLENQSYVFSVSATNENGLPLAYQWKKDGVDIPEGTSQSYTGALASAVDHGSQFAVAVSVVGYQVVSSPATLAVVSDTIPPVILSVRANEFFDKIIIVFSEPLDFFSSADPFAYSITNLTATNDIASATLQSDGRTVVLTLSTRLAENAVYSVSAPFVTDSVGNASDGTPMAVRSFALTHGFLNFAVYDTQDPNGGTGANAVSILTSHPSFPDFPRERLFLTAFDTRTAYSNDIHEAYGARITGVFIPPVSGNWIFYLRSDDNGELYLNPAGTDPAGKILLTAESACCNPFSAHASEPQPLTAGVPVYIEALYKEGVGGDVCQVAAKLDTDPTPPELLRPIPGAYLGAYVPTEGALLTILRQPTNQVASVSSPPMTVGLVDFSAGNGRFGTVSVNSPGGPWTYLPALGAWSCYDRSGCATAPRASRLNSPTLTVTSAGTVAVSFTHRYSFEDDGSTRWDGGQLRISVNRGAYVPAPLASFTANGYNGTVGGASVPNVELAGQEAFVANSPGYSTPTYVTSTAVLGPFNAGDLISIQFLAAWDDCSEGTEPNWEIKSVRFDPPLQNREVDGPVTFTVEALATISVMTNPPITYQWQRQTPAGFVDVVDANLASFSFVPTIDEDGALFRCVLRSPGDSETSADAALRLAPAITIVQSEGNAVLVWLAAPTGYSLETTGEILSPAGGTIWTPVGGTPIMIDGVNTVTISIGPGQRFFRLKKP